VPETVSSSPPTLDILGICGSLRAGSLNAMALKCAGRVMPPTMKLEIADWHAVPVFDADVLSAGVPAEVARLRERIRRADALLIVTPEYNYSVPGGLKNLIDWISRGDDQPFNGKPVAITSASMGPLGGGRVQYDLRKVMLFVNAMVMIKPEVFIGAAHTKFDTGSGECTDEATTKFLTAQMAALEKWVAGVKRMQAG
jgi:chromate reductase, NAD(P)H dehydrogenase (quinone)